MKVPFVREWGSWVVFITSLLAGLVHALLSEPMTSGRDFSLKTILAVAGMSLLVNSKNPLASVLRTKGRNKEHIFWLAFFCLSGLLLMIPFLTEGVRHFIVFGLPVLSYGVLLFMGREHHILAELNGFAILTIAAPVVYFTVTGDMSLKLYLAVFMFFAAGVFKVRARLKKTLFYRWLMVLYCIFTGLVFYLTQIPVVLLLPFAENIVSVILMREESLRRTGYTELSKGVLFLILVGGFWR